MTNDSYQHKNTKDTRPLKQWWDIQIEQFFVTLTETAVDFKSLEFQYQKDSWTSQNTEVNLKVLGQFDIKKSVVKSGKSRGSIRRAEHERSFNSDSREWQYRRVEFKHTKRRGKWAILLHFFLFLPNLFSIVPSFSVKEKLNCLVLRTFCY